VIRTVQDSGVVWGADQIEDITSVMTIVGGRIVYE
jgi:hypothetical protein